MKAKEDTLLATIRQTKTDILQKLQKLIDFHKTPTVQSLKNMWKNTFSVR